MVLIAVVSLLIGFGAASVGAQLANRHEASDSDAIYQYGHPIQGAKVLYVRDNQNLETCTQIIVLGTTIHAVPAHKDSCRF
jgi:hypothetical protein